MSDKIKEFWEAFLKKQEFLANLKQGDIDGFHEFLAEVEKIHPEMSYVYSNNTNSDNEFIITPEGKEELFGLADEIVSQAPEVKGWKFFSLKPRIGFPTHAVWEGYEVAITDVYFLPYNQENAKKIFLNIYVVGLNEEDKQEAHAAVVTAIDFGIGERDFVENIEFINVEPLLDDNDLDNCHPLEVLDEFIDWYKEKVGALN